MVTLYINDCPVEMNDGATILEAAQKAGIRIPTLCHLEGHPAQGACRVCLVEVKGARTLAASCSTPVAESMRVFTNTKRVRETRRAVVELLLSEHAGNCQTCNRSGDCELQGIARETGIGDVRFSGSTAKPVLDNSTPAIVRDNAKCIKCRRCVTVCNEIQSVGALFPQYRGFDTIIGPAFNMDLDKVACVQCGQCAAICPVGAISEKDSIQDVWNSLDDPVKHVIVQTAPAIRAALGEEFGFEPGTLVTGKMVSALRRLGFDGVFDTNFAADLTIMEEGTELLTRLKKALVDKKTSELPMFTSCSPGWIRFAEFYFPDLLANISTCKSPQQMFGAIAKTYYAGKTGKKAEDITVVSVMPCTAKKFEAYRPEMNSSGVRDIDHVLTTRELARMIKQAGIDFASLPDDHMDSPLGQSTGAADIFANTGGVMEAALRTVWKTITGNELPMENLHIHEVEGLKGLKTAAIKINGTIGEWSFLEGIELKIAVAHGLANARRVATDIRSGAAFYHFVEVMSCPGGCIGGGGQPRFTDDSVREKRISAIYKEDEGKQLRKSHENMQVRQLYDEFLKEPLGEKSHHLLHTAYTARKKV